MNKPRFGSNSLDEIDREISNLTPLNTLKYNLSSWKLFEEFCSQRGYLLNESTPVPKIAEVLKDFAFNMKRQDGSDYKEVVLKTQWNRVAKMLQQKFYKDYNIHIDPFKDVDFQNARSARDAKRKELQGYHEKRKMSAGTLSLEEHKKIVGLWDENTPEGLQRKFYHIVSYELAWRGGEAAECLVTFFEEELDRSSGPTGRIIYDPVFSKTCQGGAKRLTAKKWLIENKQNPDECPIRLFHKLLAKRGKHVTTDRLFLTPNSSWKQPNSVGFFKNSPIGRNTISKWTSTSAEKIGIDVKRCKVTNHSNRSAAVSNLAKSGVGEHQIAKITGHNSTKSISSYLDLDVEHHNTLITKLRCVDAETKEKTWNRKDEETELETDTSVSTREGKGNPTINYHNCTFNINK